MCSKKNKCLLVHRGGTTAAGKGKPGPEMPAKKRKESANGKADAGAVQAVGTGSADGIGQPR